MTRWTLLLCLVVVGCTSPPRPPVAVVEPQPRHNERIALALLLLAQSPPDVAGARRVLASVAQEGDAQVLLVAEAATAVVDAVDMHLSRRAELEREIVSLRTQLEETEAALAGKQKELDDMTATSGRLAEERNRLRKQVEEQSAQLSKRAQELTKLKDELEALKRIDLNRAP